MSMQSISDLALLTGKDRMTISKRLKDIPFEQGPRNSQLYDTIVALEAIYRADYLDKDKNLDRILYQIEQQRLRKMTLANDEQEGQLIDSSLVKKALEKEYTIVRTKLYSLPSKLAQPLVLMTDAKEIFTTILNSIEEALEALVTSSEEPIQEQVEIKDNAEQAE